MTSVEKKKGLEIASLIYGLAPFNLEPMKENKAIVYGHVDWLQINEKENKGLAWRSQA